MNELSYRNAACTIFEEIPCSTTFVRKFLVSEALVLVNPSLNLKNTIFTPHPLQLKHKEIVVQFWLAFFLSPA